MQGFFFGIAFSTKAQTGIPDIGGRALKVVNAYFQDCKGIIPDKNENA
jgi:hypothetical protein